MNTYFEFSETIDQRLRKCHAPSGFDYMRLFLAIAVVLVHSVLVSYGDESFNLIVWSWPLRGPARMILCMFFALSGFLVAGSIFRTGSVFGFIGLRVLRLVPALTTEVFITAIMLGGIFTTLPAEEYFKSEGFWNYFLNIIGDVHQNLPGVFENNPVKNGVNGVLWTVPKEMDCYCILVALMVTGLIKHRLFVFYCTFYGMIALVLSGSIRNMGIYGPVDSRTLIICFLWGITFYLYRDKVRLSFVLFCISLTIAILLMHLRSTAFLASPFVTYATVYLGLFNPRKIPPVSIGDYSYGVYLYGGPIQQMITYLTPSHRVWWVNFMVSLPLAFFLAVISWHGIEKRILRLKSFVADNNGFLARSERALVLRLRESTYKFYAMSTTPKRMLSAEDYGPYLPEMVTRPQASYQMQNAKLNSDG